MTFFLNNNKTAHTIYIRLFCFVLNIFYSQLHMNGIEQQAMSIQALSFLHVQGIHSVISV